MTRQEHIEAYRACVEKMHKEIDAKLATLAKGIAPEASSRDTSNMAHKHLKAAMAIRGPMNDLAKIVERDKEYIAKLERALAMSRLLMVKQGHMPNFGPDNKTVQ